ncbi:MAG TPA: NAD-dependent DNA ligase LigA [Spirochaetia bacterium]|nr:NAD-dependent DNA ligase LigA [Spirochaetia bacterium]
MTENEAAEEIKALSAKINRFNYEYHVLASPSVSDLEYDRLFDQLKKIEGEFPELRLPDSPTLRVGSDLSNDLPEVDHTIPVLSLDKAYSIEELMSWARKASSNIGDELTFAVEEKIDGVSIVLYYEKGLLDRAVTRGNGLRGNDVTANVRTIRSIPLRLAQPETVAVRGEIYLPRERFEEINSSMEVPYANPRNLAAGSLRRIKSSAVAAVPLAMFAYEGYFPDPLPSHVEVIHRLAALGLRVNPTIGLFSDAGATRPHFSEPGGPSWVAGNFDDMAAFVRRRTEERSSLGYEIDGLVVKVNDLAAREELGYTGHHPRWAIAFKFEAPEGVTEVRAIDVQVGRTGRVTPVARVKPVQVGGSTISNITLHNQDYVDLLELGIGDTVAISRRGDVIPAVERVIEKNEESTTWKMPATCPVCAAQLTIVGAHHFCPNRECPAQVRGRIFFFVGRGQMDIDNLGPETIEVLIQRGMVRDVVDLYTADYDSLSEVGGFGEKKIALIKEGIERSKARPYVVVLQSLGIPELGQKVSELLIDAGFTSVDLLLECVDSGEVDRLTEIPGIGEKTAATIIEELSRPEVRRVIERLRVAGLTFEAEAKAQLPAEERIFEGQTWCVTGSFENFNPRSKAIDEIKLRGGKVVSAVSGTTTHLLAGSSAGSKLKRAAEVGAQVVTEAQFVELIAK